MRATQLQETLSAMIEQKVPTFIWGAPGIGKSSIVKAIAQKRGIDFIDLRLSLMDPTDLKGIPFYDAKAHTALWAPPAFLPKEGEGILFLDELNAAPPSVQASAYQLILDRRVGDYILPDGYAIVAAGNREGDRGVVYKMSSPLANRFVHLHMEVDVQDWRLWAYEVGISSAIIAYITCKNEKLFTFEPLDDAKSFATPRSWEFVDRLLKSSLSEALLLDAIGGAIGKEVAIDFLSFAKVADSLPDLEAILEGKAVEVDEDIESLYVLISALTSLFMQEKSAKKLDNLIRFSMGIKSEFAVLLIQDLQRSGVDMHESEAFDAWIEKFAYLLA